MKINFLPTKEHYFELTSEQGGVDNYISKVKQLTTELEAISISPFLYTINDEYKETLEFTCSILGLGFKLETEEYSSALEDKTQYQLDIESAFTLYEIHKDLTSQSYRFLIPAWMSEFLGEYGEYNKS